MQRHDGCRDDCTEAAFPLTSGQASAWMNFAGSPPEHLAMPCWWTIPGDVPAATVAAAVAALTARHEMTRTTIETDAETGVRQRVWPPGPPELRSRPDLVVDLADEQARTAVVAGFEREAFDLGRDWPVRWYLGRQPSGDHALIAIVHHFASGYQGCLVLRAELPAVIDNLGHGRAPDHGLPPVRSPRDLVDEEDGPRGRRRDARARDHVRQILTGLPSTAFPPRPGTETVRDHRIGVTLTSPALHTAVEELSKRWQVPASFVVLAGFSLAVRPLLVVETALAWRVFGDQGGDRPLSVSASYQPVTTLVRADGLAEGEDLRAASAELYRRMLAALRVRGFGESAVIEEAHRVSRERGVRVEVPFWFNFVTDEGDIVPGPDELADYEGDDVPGDDFLLYVWHTREQPTIGLYAHERYVDVAALRDVLARFGALVRGTPTADPEPPRAPAWTHLGGGRWGSPVVVRDVLCALDGVAAADVHAEGAVLRAEIRSSRSADELRAAALARLDVPGFVIPDVIRVHAADTAAPVAPPDPPALAGLVAAVRRLCGVADVDPATSYLAAGGTARAIPSVLHAVSAAGWAGLTWRDLCSHRPLRVLAAGLDRT